MLPFSMFRPRPSLPLPAFLHSVYSLFTTPYSLSSIFSHDYPLFCAAQNLNSFRFIDFRTLCTKHRGWVYSTFADSLFSPLSSECAPVTPFPAALTSHPQLAENATTLSPAFATLTRRVKLNPFVCHSYRKHPGWVYPPAKSFLSPLDRLLTRHSRSGRPSARCRSIPAEHRQPGTSPLRIRTSKTQDLNLFRMNTYKKNGVRAPTLRHNSQSSRRGRRRSGELEAFELDVGGAKVGQIVMSLLGEPRFGAAAEDFGETDGHLRGDAALPIDQFGESGASDTEGRRGLRDRQAERLDALAQDKAARMRWILHRHGLFSFRGDPSMIVEIVDIERIAIGETKNHSPVRPDGDRPKAFHLALERMQPESGQIHISDVGRSVETNKNVAESFGVLAHDAAMIVVIVKALEAFVADRPDHNSA